MKKYILYMGIISLIGVFSFLLYLYQIGIENFFNEVFKHVGFLIGAYILSFIIVNFMNMSVFYIIGKFYKKRCCILNMYPFFLLGNKFKSSFFLIDCILLENTYDCSGVTPETIDTFIKTDRELNNIQTYIKVVLMLSFIVLGFVLKISLFHIIVSMFLLKAVTVMYFNEIDMSTHQNILLFNNIIYSKEVSKSLLQYHLNYLVQHIDEYFNTPEDLKNTVFIIFAYYAHARFDLQELYLLDKAMFKMLSEHQDEISISGRSIVFDYLDYRICLGHIEEKGKDVLMDALNLYISINWGTKMPTFYITRYKALKERLQYKKRSVEIDRKYSIFVRENV